MHISQVGKYSQQLEQMKGDLSATQKRYKDASEEVLYTALPPTNLLTHPPISILDRRKAL